VICERDSHIFNYESGSPAALSGLQLHPIGGELGVFSSEQVEPVIRPESAYYMPRTKIIEVENTHVRSGGTIWPIENIISLKILVEKYNLKYHLDGARIWNASVATGISVKEYASYFDSISCCLSKGLGAPVGSLIGSTKEFIKEAYRVRKAWGGGMRQVGILAAAGLYALKNNIPRLAEDHANAKFFADKISEMKDVEINLRSVQTNIITFKPTKLSPENVIEKCEKEGLLISTGKIGWLRAVTHLDVNREQIQKALEIVGRVFKQ
jgi:threonine aldolase